MAEIDDQLSNSFRTRSQLRDHEAGMLADLAARYLPVVAGLDPAADWKTNIERSTEMARWGIDAARSALRGPTDLPDGSPTFMRREFSCAGTMTNGRRYLRATFPHGGNLRLRHGLGFTVSSPLDTGRYLLSRMSWGESSVEASLQITPDPSASIILRVGGEQVAVVLPSAWDGSAALRVSVGPDATRFLVGYADAGQMITAPAQLPAPSSMDLNSDTELALLLGSDGTSPDLDIWPDGAARYDNIKVFGG